MKITKLTTYIVPPRWCFLKIETDEGIVGWGEPVLEGRAHTVAAAVDELATTTKRPVLGLTVTDPQSELEGKVRGVHVIPSVDEAAMFEL